MFIHETLHIDSVLSKALDKERLGVVEGPARLRNKTSDNFSFPLNSSKAEFFQVFLLEVIT